MLEHTSSQFVIIDISTSGILLGYPGSVPAVPHMFRCLNYVMYTIQAITIDRQQKTLNMFGA